MRGGRSWEGGWLFKGKRSEEGREQPGGVVVLSGAERQPGL